MISDQTCILQLFRDLGDAGPTDAHHLSEEFLRQRQLVADQLMHPQEPLADPRLHLVNGVARGRLLDLRRHELLIRERHHSKFRVLF